MDVSHDESLWSPGQNDGEEERSTPAQMVQRPAIPYASILDHMPDAFLILDRQGRITYLNQQVEPFLQKTKAQLLGSSIWEAIPKIRDTPLFQYCRQAKTAGKTASFEYCSSAANKWFHVHIYPSEEGVCVYFQDITERKKAEERLRQSEKRFRALIENNADGIALTDANGVITYVSPSTTCIAGFLPEEFTGHRVFERMVYPADQEATGRLLARVLQEPGKSQVLEYRTRHKDGTFLWIEVVGINLLDEPGVEAIVWNFRDLTQRKRLEQEAAKAKEQLEVILNNVANGIVVADANNSLVYVNDVAARMVGFPSAAAMLAAPQSAFGQSLRRFATWDEQGRPLPFEERPGARASQGKKAHALVLYQDTLNGHGYWTLVRAQPIFDAQGQVQFVVSVFTDITEQKEFEQRKDHFISMASHELKTPLTILSAFTQLMRERFEAEDRQDVLLHLSKMDDQITRLTRLVANLLDISKMQEGKLKLAQEAVDMDELVREVVENLQPTTNHHLLIEGAAQRTITGDRDRLGQVLMNLLTNAIKYSPQAETVVVRVEQTRNTLTVSVHDFGIGIAQSHQEKLFERFYRVYSEKDQTYPGLGIGLYIAHEIIQRHGGKMWVDSVEGKGSIFSFSLPIR
jgi:two-component system, OmpR family, phosphate regulon sensor histidine kinase PhoR